MEDRKDMGFTEYGVWSRLEQKDLFAMETVSLSHNSDKAPME